MAILIFVVSIISMKMGAVHISLEEILNAFKNSNNSNLNERIFMEIRLPRTILCIFAGAALALGGVLMQGLFLNPIVEPGLIGTSSGAAFGAALYFTLGASIPLEVGEWTLPIAACIGAAIATYLVYFLSQNKSSRKTSTIALLLIGIAINALFLSGVGFLSYIARDPQARSITFWNLGTLSGANWHSVIIVGIITLIGLYISIRYAKSLNALMLGESEAEHLGINVKKLKLKVLTINVILVAVATSFIGVIAFVGLIVPHLLRLIKGSNSKYLMIGSTLLGALILCIADLFARLLLAPAELPIGIVTTVVGAPIFIYLLRKIDYYF